MNDLPLNDNYNTVTGSQTMQDNISISFYIYLLLSLVVYTKKTHEVQACCKISLRPGPHVFIKPVRVMLKLDFLSHRCFRKMQIHANSNSNFNVSQESSTSFSHPLPRHPLCSDPGCTRVRFFSSQGSKFTHRKSWGNGASCRKPPAMLLKCSKQF